jgi:glycosyltransferase involved in cell wall biosynthesis
MKVYEYLAAGLPVVASAVGQLPALLDHGGLGVLVTPGDRAALGRALAALRSDTATRAALRTAGRAAAEQRHTWSGVVEQILDLGVGRVPA